MLYSLFWLNIDYLYHPFSVRPVAYEVPVDDVLRDAPDFAFIRMVFLLPSLSGEGHFAHQPLDLLVVYGHSLVP